METLTINEIEALVRNDESRTLELKETTGEIVKAMTTACAFLNTDGGWLLFGITPKLKIVGQNVTDNTKQEIANHLRKFDPAIDASVQYVELTDKPGFYVIAIFFDKRINNRPPYAYDGRAYYKVESTTTPMPRNMFEERLRQNNPDRFSWEKLPNKKVSIDDLDTNAIIRTVQEGVRQNRIPAVALIDMSPKSLVRNLELVDGDDLMNASVVLFAKQPTHFILQCSLRLARFEGRDMTEFRDQTVCEGNLFEQFNEAMNFCRKHMFLAGRMDEDYRVDTLTVPYKALREAILNCLCHRTWEADNLTPSIAIFNDRMRIQNPGHFPSGLTWKDFIEGQGSIPHNPTIANVLYKSGMMERWGRGIQLIIDECIKQKLPEPQFETTPYFVNLTIWFKEPLEPRDIEDVAKDVAKDVVKDVVKELSERQQFIIDLISNEPTLSAKVISERFSDKVVITPRTVQRDLAVLQKKGILAREGGRKDGRWVIIQPQ